MSLQLQQQAATEKWGVERPSGSGYSPSLCYTRENPGAEVLAAGRTKAMQTSSHVWAEDMGLGFI